METAFSVEMETKFYELLDYNVENEASLINVNLELVYIGYSTVIFSVQSSGHEIDNTL